MKSIFIDCIGNCLRTRTIEYFLEWDGIKIIPKDLVDAEVGNIQQVNKEITYLLSNNFIRKKGKGYTLNKYNKVAKNFLVLFKAILKQEIPKLESKFKKH